MRMLVISEVKDLIDQAYIHERLPGVQVTLNSFPVDGEDAIAIFECKNANSIKWDWPDTVIQVGQCQLGRNHVDITVSPDEGTEKVIEYYTVTENPEEEEERPYE